MYDRRIFDARQRQERIAKRVDDLRKIVGKATTRDLSNKERAFVDEVRTLGASVSGPQEGEEAETQRQSNELWRRLENVKRLQAELIVDVESVRNEGTAEAPSTQELRIPQDIRRSKLQQVQSLLSRETALVEAVTSRLERLQATV